MERFEDFSKIKTVTFRTTCAKELRGCMDPSNQHLLLDVTISIPEENKIQNGYDLTAYLEKTTNFFVLEFLKFNNKKLK